MGSSGSAAFGSGLCVLLGREWAPQGWMDGLPVPLALLEATLDGAWSSNLHFELWKSEFLSWSSPYCCVFKNGLRGNLVQTQNWNFFRISAIPQFKLGIGLKSSSLKHIKNKPKQKSLGVSDGTVMMIMINAINIICFLK